MTFDSSQFTPTKWSTAQDKAAFANRFIRLVQSDFAAKHFTEKFYQRLTNTFSHIAHYNRGGFWDTFFTSTADKVRFLKMTVQYPCHGDPAWTYSDVEQAVRAWLKAVGTLEQYQQRLADEIEAGERALLARLQQKYGQAAQSS